MEIAGRARGLEVVLCGGRRIEVRPGFDAPTLEGLIAVLERASEAVFGIGPATQIYLAVGATDMRKGFNGLLIDSNSSVRRHTIQETVLGLDAHVKRKPCAMLASKFSV